MAAGAAWGDGGAGGPSAAGLGRALWALDPWLPADGPGCPPASAPVEGAGGLSFDGIWGGAVPGGACPLYLGSAAPEWASAAPGPRGGGGGQTSEKRLKRERSAWEEGPPAGMTICPAGVMGSFCPPPQPAAYYPGDDVPRKQPRSYGEVLRNQALPSGPRPPRTPPVAVPGQPLSGLGTRSTIQPFNSLVKERSYSLSVEDVNQRVQASAWPPAGTEGESLPPTPPNCHPPRYLAAALTPVSPGWA